MFLFGWNEQQEQGIRKGQAGLKKEVHFGSLETFCKFMQQQTMRVE